MIDLISVLVVFKMNIAVLNPDFTFEHCTINIRLIFSLEQLRGYYKICTRNYISV